jgi:hypothetical protein
VKSIELAQEFRLEPTASIVFSFAPFAQQRIDFVDENNGRLGEYTIA